jgi:hypothetical protein
MSSAVEVAVTAACDDAGRVPTRRSGSDPASTPHIRSTSARASPGRSPGGRPAAALGSAPTSTAPRSPPGAAPTRIGHRCAAPVQRGEKQSGDLRGPLARRGPRPPARSCLVHVRSVLHQTVEPPRPQHPARGRTAADCRRTSYAQPGSSTARCGPPWCRSCARLAQSEEDASGASSSGSKATHSTNGRGLQVGVGDTGRGRERPRRARRGSRVPPPNAPGPGSRCRWCAARPGRTCCRRRRPRRSVGRRAAPRRRRVACLRQPLGGGLQRLRSTTPAPAVPSRGRAPADAGPGRPRSV